MSNSIHVEAILNEVRELVGPRSRSDLDDALQRLVEAVTDHAATRQQVADANKLYAEAQWLIKKTPGPYATSLSSVINRCADLVGRNT